MNVINVEPEARVCGRTQERKASAAHLPAPGWQCTRLRKYKRHCNGIILSWSPLDHFCPNPSSSIFQTFVLTSSLRSKLLKTASPPQSDTFDYKTLIIKRRLFIINTGYNWSFRMELLIIDTPEQESPLSVFHHQSPGSPQPSHS